MAVAAAALPATAVAAVVMAEAVVVAMVGVPVTEVGMKAAVGSPTFVESRRMPRQRSAPQQTGKRSKQ